MFYLTVGEKEHCYGKWKQWMKFLTLSQFPKNARYVNSEGMIPKIAGWLQPWAEVSLITMPHTLAWTLSLLQQFLLKRDCITKCVIWRQPNILFLLTLFGILSVQITQVVVEKKRTRKGKGGIIGERELQLSLFLNLKSKILNN